MMKEEYTWAGLVDFHGPAHLCEGNGGETAHGTCANYDKLSSHVLNDDREPTGVIFCSDDHVTY
jgi:hypothetical protein